MLNKNKYALVYVIIIIILLVYPVWMVLASIGVNGKFVDVA